MQWIDVASEREGWNKGIAFRTPDGNTIVSPAPDGAGGMRADAWIVWALENGERAMFPGVTFKSCEAAMSAAESARESAVAWVVMEVARRVQWASHAMQQLSAEVARRIGS